MLKNRGVHLHVFYRGQDVTNDCCFADDTGEGMAELFLRNADGKHYLNQSRTGAAKEIVYGVTLREGAPFS